MLSLGRFLTALRVLDSFWGSWDTTGDSSPVLLTSLSHWSTDASNFGLGGVLSQIQNNVECVIAYCSRALRPSQRKYCTTKRDMLAAISMCIQFRSYLRGAKFTLIWLHRFKDTEGMMARWLHTLQQFQFSNVHRAGNDHGNADGLSRAPTSPCRQCTRVDCPQVDTSVVVADQPFDAVSVGDSEDADLIPLQSVKIGWHSWMMICPVRPLSLVKFSVSPHCNLKTQHVSRYWSGSGLILFLLGRRLSHCVRSCDFCGIIRIICQRMRMVFCGGNGVPKYLNYSYWYQNQDVNSCSWLIILTDWRSSRPELHLSPIESAVLLVGYG